MFSELDSVCVASRGGEVLTCNFLSDEVCRLRQSYHTCVCVRERERDRERQRGREREY